MKRLIFGVICASVLLSPINIYGREIQISDYRYTKCVHLMDGYTYCMNGERGEILNPGGHKIYSTSDYTAPYEMGFTSSTLYKGGELLTISYPQGETGNRFIIYSPEKQAMGLINEHSEIIAPVEYSSIRLMGPNYFGFYRQGKRGILSAEDGHVVAETEREVYIGDNMLNYAFADVFTENGRQYAIAEFYNRDGLKIQSLEGEELSTSPFYDTDNKAFKDRYGNTYRKVNLGDGYKYIEYATPTSEEFMPWEYNGYDILKPSNQGEIKSDRVDNSYIFKYKEIGDKTYCAVFAEVSDNPDEPVSVGYYDFYSSPTRSENTACVSWIPKECSSLVSISQYNCFINNISRQDFCILLLNAYMFDQGLDITDYAGQVDISDIKFSDTDDVYIRLAVKMGLINPCINSEFKPYSPLTRAEAAVSFSRLSKLMENKGSGLGRHFSDISNCTGEQKKALRSLSKLNNANLGYVIMTEDENFYPDENISTEDAYAIAFRLATYNKAGGHEYMDWVEFLGWLALCTVGVCCLIYKRNKRKRTRLS